MRYQSHIYLNTHLHPKIFHPLTYTSLSPKQYQKLKKTNINPAISSMGYNRAWPLAMRYGTHDYGGLQLKDLSTEVVIKKIKCIQDLFYKKYSSNSVNLLISRYQHVSGLSTTILENSHQATTYVNII